MSVVLVSLKLVQSYLTVLRFTNYIYNYMQYQDWPPGNNEKKVMKKKKTWHTKWVH